MKIDFNFVPQFKAPVPPLLRPSISHPGVVRIASSSTASSSSSSSSFGSEDKALSIINYPPHKDNFPISVKRWKSIEIHHEPVQGIGHPAVSPNGSKQPPELTFNKLLPYDEEIIRGQKRIFGRFIIHEAFLDEEYWTAAFLRAQAHYETLSYVRHVDSYKRQYAEKEFYALKQRCSRQDGNSLKCFCIIAVKREERNIRRTALNSVVGTLDLSIRQFLQGEIYPGVHRKSAVMSSQDPLGAHRYAYIANACVSKSSRRRGIALNMVYLAIDIATSAGVKQLYVHANTDNEAAQILYMKAGFKMVDDASYQLSKGQRVLLSMQL